VGGARAAERLLRSAVLAPASGPVLLHAVRVLLDAGLPHRAALWCAKLRPRAQSAVWAAAFGALGAEALLQLGELAGAECEAGRALEAAGGRPGGLYLWPAAVRAEALIALGRWEEAAAGLGAPVPQARWAAVPWWRARGRLHLAAHRYQDALEVFRVTGRLALRHGAGRLPHLPWRGDVAEALLGLGRAGAARALLAEELALPALGPRHRAGALRLLAATDEAGRRPHTLACAIGELRRCGDRAELARAMADLARALDVLGDSCAAGFGRRAGDLAAECGLPLAAPAAP
jgi:hypothetical protein